MITHVARNADSFTWLCAGAIAGESRHQYPTTGMREADIETGSKLPSFELLADLERSCRALDTSFDTLDDGLWDFEVSVRTGRRPLTEIVFSRLREVEVHHVDLAAAYTSSDWPEIYVEGEMNRLLPGLASRADHAAIVQWLIGRGGAPDLGPW